MSKLFQFFVAKMSESVAMIIVIDDEFDEKIMRINISIEQFRNDIKLINLKKVNVLNKKTFDFKFSIYNIQSFFVKFLFIDLFKRYILIKLICDD